MSAKETGTGPLQSRWRALCRAGRRIRGMTGIAVTIKTDVI